MTIAHARAFVTEGLSSITTHRVKSAKFERYIYVQLFFLNWKGCGRKVEGNSQSRYRVPIYTRAMGVILFLITGRFLFTLFSFPQSLRTPSIYQAVQFSTKHSFNYYLLFSLVFFRGMYTSETLLFLTHTVPFAKKMSFREWHFP